MKAPKLRLISSNRNSITLTWTPGSDLSSRGSATNVLQKSSRQSRALITLDDRKLSRMNLTSIEVTPTNLPLPPTLFPEKKTVPENYEQRKEWYTLQKKDKLLGWDTVYWGFKSEVEISPLSPGDVYQFRIKISTTHKCSDWSETLTATTKDESLLQNFCIDEIVSAASLHRALDQGHATSARKVLASRLQALEIPSKLGRTPLASATTLGDTAVVSMLLTCGADVNAQETGSHRTPIMTASFWGNADLLHVLKERDASWIAKDRFGQTALHYGALNAQLTSIEQATKDIPDINMKDNFGWTPLMLAVSMRASVEVLENLLNKGASVNSCDKRGQTPLMQAVLTSRPEVVQLFLEKGADILSQNVYGHCSFDMAKASSDQPILKILSKFHPGYSSNSCGHDQK